MKKWLPAISVIAIIAIGAFVANQFRESDTETTVIAIATLMSHPALDAVQENLKAELARQGYVEGEM